MRFRNMSAEVAHDRGFAVGLMVGGLIGLFAFPVMCWIAGIHVLFVK